MKLTAGCFALILLFNVTIAGFMVNWLTKFLFAVNLAWWKDVLIGLVGGQLVVPAFFISLVLKLVGLHSPLFHQ